MKGEKRRGLIGVWDFYTEQAAGGEGGKELFESPHSQRPPSAHSCSGPLIGLAGPALQENRAHTLVGGFPKPLVFPDPSPFHNPGPLVFRARAGWELCQESS